MGNSYQGWPVDWPKYCNGSVEPCDMLVGPCCCGATHQEGEFIWGAQGLLRVGRVVVPRSISIPTEPRFVYVIMAYDYIGTKPIAVAANPKKAAEMKAKYERSPKWKDRQIKVEKLNLAGEFEDDNVHEERTVV